MAFPAEEVEAIRVIRSASQGVTRTAALGFAKYSAAVLLDVLTHSKRGHLVYLVQK
jgi:hypothetical protein